VLVVVVLACLAAWWAVADGSGHATRAFLPP
jgi:hypothetical protein